MSLLSYTLRNLLARKKEMLSTLMVIGVTCTIGVLLATRNGLLWAIQNSGDPTTRF